MATASASLPPVAFTGLHAEQPPAAILEALSSVVARLAAAATPTTWSALSLSTQRGTFLPVDAAGAPVAPLVSWLDRRTSLAGGDRWDWFLREASDTAARTCRLLTLASWLTLSLTGEAADTAQTQAPESGRRGSPARLVAPGAVVGSAAGALARSLSLPPTLPVVLAGGDKNTELVGAGCVSPGKAVVSFGTAVSLGLLAAGSASAPGTFVTPSHVPGLTQIEIGLPYGGGVWSWLASLFPDAARDLADAALTDAAPLFVPYLAGSLGDPHATGSWHGLTASTTPRQLVASGLEGIVMDLRRGAAALPSPLTDVTLTGGGAASPVLASWLADALAVPVRSVQSGDTGLAGAAMSAAVALAWVPDWPAAAGAFAPRTTAPVAPAEASRARWSRRFQRWQELAARG